MSTEFIRKYWAVRWIMILIVIATYTTAIVTSNFHKLDHMMNTLDSQTTIEMQLSNLSNRVWNVECLVGIVPDKTTGLASQ